jgi:hypothetical protein
VQFARSIHGDGEYAIKFFALREAFHIEMQMYADKTLREFLPIPQGIHDNENGEFVDARGIKLPPFIIMEKGESLDDWSKRKRPNVFAATPVRALLPKLSVKKGCGLTF